MAPGPSTSLTATKRVCLIRHGQGAHNASIKNWKLIDPPLNEVGLAQAAKLCETLKAGEIKPREFDVVCVSPLTRAMQTAKGGFKGTKVPFHVTPSLRERMGAPCDAASRSRSCCKLNPEMRGWGGIDQLEEEWWGAGTGEAEWALLERVDALKACARAARADDRPRRPRRDVRAHHRPPPAQLRPPVGELDDGGVGRHGARLERKEPSY